MNLEIKQADYHDEKDAAAIVMLLDGYARDPMGGGKPLDEEVLNNIVSTLADYPTAFTILAYVDDQPVGLINCFESLSTFRGKPLLNIHDVVIIDACRRQGIAEKMFLAVEREAKSRGACKLTLEVLEGNEPARVLYQKQGFKGYELDPKMGHALFWQKELN